MSLIVDKRKSSQYLIAPNEHCRPVGSRPVLLQWVCIEQALRIQIAPRGAAPELREIMGIELHQVLNYWRLRRRGARDRYHGLIFDAWVHHVGLCPTPAVGAAHYTVGGRTRMLPVRGARGRKGLTVKVLISVLLAACLSGCLGNGGNIPHEDSEGATPHNEGAPLWHDGTPPPCVIRN